LPLIAAFSALLAPTLVLNSAFWGQADAVYACVLLASIYFMARRKDGIAMALYSLGLALKAQAIFLLPLLAALALRREIRWRMLLWIPLVFLLVLVPALIAGRPLLDLLQIYPSQASQYEQLSMHAPSSLAWIPDSGRYYQYFYSSGMILAAAMAIAFSWAIYRSSVKLTPDLLIELALVSVVLVPFFLPKMHERYFYLADILSIVFAFYVPAYFFVPLLMITVSFFAYQPTLFGVEPVSLGLLALGVFFVLVALLRHALPRLFPSTTKL
jgi:Gpi18-like mannosyltransferase